MDALKETARRLDAAPVRLSIGGAPDGFDALLLAALAEADGKGRGHGGGIRVCGSLYPRFGFPPLWINQEPPWTRAANDCCSAAAIAA